MNRGTCLYSRSQAFLLCLIGKGKAHLVMRTRLLTYAFVPSDLLVVAALSQAPVELQSEIIAEAKFLFVLQILLQSK